MLGDRCRVGAWRIRCHDPGCLQCIEVKVVVANADALDEAHTRHEGEQARIHFPMDDEQDLSFRSILSEVFLTGRRDRIKADTGRKRWPKALDHGGRERVDQQDSGHEKPPSRFPGTKSNITCFHVESQGSRKEATIRTGIKLQEKREVVNTRSQKIQDFSKVAASGIVKGGSP